MHPCVVLVGEVPRRKTLASALLNLSDPGLFGPVGTAAPSPCSLPDVYSAGLDAPDFCFLSFLSFSGGDGRIGSWGFSPAILLQDLLFQSFCAERSIDGGQEAT